MFTFLAAFGVPHRPVRALIESAARVTLDVMPSLDATLHHETTVLDWMNAGWFIVRPEPLAGRALVSGWVGGDHAVVAFGRMNGTGSDSLARTVARTYREKGPDAVHELDGCFGAVIADRENRRVVILGDQVGGRSPRYFTQGSAIYVSPHDVPLAATGLLELDLDLVGAASSVSMDWSLGGRSLLRAVETCSPSRIVRFDEGRLTSRARHVLVPGERLDPGDHRGISANNEAMIEIMRDNTIAHVQDSDRVRIDLTAGWDSRAVLGLLRSVVDESRIMARTDGEPGDQDVAVARLVAARSGIDHHTEEVRSPCLDDFDRHADLLSFHMNGDTNAMRAIAPLPSAKDCLLPRLQGAGGALVRGYLYPPSPHLGGLFTPRMVVSWLRLWFSRLNTIPWICDELQRGVVERLEGAVYRNVQRTSNGHDLLDLMFLEERYAHWGAMGSRFTWQEMWTPFRSPALVRRYWKMPPAAGLHCRVHRTLIRRHVPEAGNIPINGTVLLPVHESLPVGLQPLARTLTGWGFSIVKRARWVRRRRPQRMLRSEAIAGPLGERFRDVLGSPSSIAAELLGSRNVHAMLDAHIARRTWHLQTLGQLMAMEHWRSQVRTAARLASRHHDLVCRTAPPSGGHPERVPGEIVVADEKWGGAISPRAGG